MPVEPKKLQLKKLTAVVLVNDLASFGLHTKKLSHTMMNLSMELEGDKVVLKHAQYPGKEIVLFPAGIASVELSTPEESGE